MAKEDAKDEQEWECPHCGKTIVIPVPQKEQANPERCPECNADTVTSEDGTVSCNACDWQKVSE